MTDSFKPSVLRGVAMTAQTRTLGVPRHRGAAEAEAKPEATRAAASSVVQAIKPVTPVGAYGMPTQVVAAPTDVAVSKAVAEGFEEGREAGLREGLVEAQKRLDEALDAAMKKVDEQAASQAAQQRAEHALLMERLAGTLNGLEAALAARLETLETDAIELAFEAVCRLMGESRGDRAAVSGLVLQAMGQLRAGTLLRVRLHPDDLDALEGDALIARHPAVQWQADTKVALGGCMLDTESGTLDARLDRQLKQLRNVWVASHAAHAAADLDHPHLGA